MTGVLDAPPTAGPTGPTGLAGLAGPAGPAGLVGLADRAGLAVRAAAAWPRSTEDRLPGLPGFIESSFSPLVAEVAHRCLRAAYGNQPAEPRLGERTAVVVTSGAGDVASALRVAAAVAAGQRVGPLQFFQSVPNAVAGHIAARWGLSGPVVCLGSATAGIDVAALLIDDGDADEALVVFAEQAGPTGDRAEAVLVQRVRP
jgi:hypothetical protein